MGKRLFIIGGPMGVGKSEVCRLLNKKLDNSVYLDGDWCWNMSPFRVTEETKALVMDNIRHMLGKFLGCSAFDNIVFCWVMHEQSIIDDILAGLDTHGWEVKCISLVCSADALCKRLEGDIVSGVRTPDVVPRALARLQAYDNTLRTAKIDTSELTVEQTAELIAGM